MKFKKIHVTKGKATLLICLFMVPIVTIEGMAKPRKGPFAAIWKAIKNLQKQIDNIELIPGPEGPQGPPGEDGRDAPGGIIVGILDPDYGETVSGIVTIRAIIFGSEDSTLSILLNSTEIGTALPMEWNSLTVDDGWWNITVVATDMPTNDFSSDEVIVNIKNFDVTYINVMPNLIVPYGFPEVYFDVYEGVEHSPYSLTNGKYCLYQFVIPDNYFSTEDIIFHLVWSTPDPRLPEPTIDHMFVFATSWDGSDRMYQQPITSSWTGAGQRKSNFETLTIDFLNPGNLLHTKVCLEEHSHESPVYCYGVWLEVPVT